jgi:hypothetical protein
MDEAQAAALRAALERVRAAMIATGQGGDGDDDPRYPLWNTIVAALASDPGKAFEERIRAEEREACAKIADRWAEEDDRYVAGPIAAAIRARGTS